MPGRYIERACDSAAVFVLFLKVASKDGVGHSIPSRVINVAHIAEKAKTDRTFYNIRNNSYYHCLCSQYGHLAQINQQ